MTRPPTPLIATATKSPLPHVTPRHIFSVALAWLVQVTPSGEVCTRLPVPLIATATKSPLPHVTLSQLFVTALFWLVQLKPSGEVCNPPSKATATKSPPPYVTPSQRRSAALFWLVQLKPSGEVCTRLPVPDSATATKSPRHTSPCIVGCARLARPVDAVGRGLHSVGCTRFSDGYEKPVSPRHTTHTLSAALFWIVQTVPGATGVAEGLLDGLEDGEAVGSCNGNCDDSYRKGCKGVRVMRPIDEGLLVSFLTHLGWRFGRLSSRGL